jgi:hypothetical protein
MKIKFSQKWVQVQHGSRIRQLLWHVVKLARVSKKCDRLLVKVFFYQTDRGYSGSYRHIAVHGFYESEWEKYADKFHAIVTLKFPKKATDKQIVELFAHELGHHLSYLKSKRFGERKADKFAQKIVSKWESEAQ